jgi:outer membrane protein assembly factor BamA
VEHNITEGSRFRIGQVAITGNTITHDNAIRRVLDEEKFTPGTWYNADTARGNGEGELEKTLKGTVYSESATIAAMSSSDPNRKDALVTISEDKPARLSWAWSAATAGHRQIAYEQRN